MSFWLPKLITGHTINKGTGTNWVSDNKSSTLTSIYEGLDIANIGSQVVESVPSMWARATLFEAALSHSKSVGQSEVDKAIIGEWRGLLALLAFADLSQYELGFTQMDFRNDPCLQKMSSQLPRNTFLKDADWNLLFLITYKNVPFAFTSPATLVCTGTDYAKVFGPEVNWFNGTRLVDPSTCLNNLHKRLLAYWLKQLFARVSSYENRIEEHLLLSVVKNMLQEFMDDLGFGNIQLDPNKDSNQGKSNKPYIEYSIFEQFTRPLVYLDEESDIILKCKSGVSDILLFTDNMKKEDRNVIVYGAITLDLLKNTNYSERMIGNRNLNRFKLYKGEDWLFLDDIYLVDEDKMQPEYKTNYALCWDIQGNVKNVMVIYPFKEAILEYLPIDYIKNNTKFETIQSGSVKKLRVKVTLELSGGQQEFIKEYLPQNIHSFSNVPLAAIWPAYDLGDQWNEYYFYNNRTYFNEDYKDFSLIPYGALNLKFSEENIPVEIHVTLSYPEVLIVNYNGINVGFIKMINPIEKFQNVQYLEPGCKIGIDFGTCSSTVFYSTDSNKQPRIFKYPQRSKTVTKSINEFHFWEQFLPYDSISPELTTIDRYFHTLFRYFNDNPEESIIHGNIFYSYNLLDYSTNEFGGIAKNLKWAADGSINAACAKPFLEQIVKQTLLELILQKIDIFRTEWCFSYPTAFSNKQYKTLKDNSESVVRNCYERIICRNESANQLKIKHNTMTESVSAARYFLGTNQGTVNSLAGGFVSIDIGGGTTDISFWQNRTQKGNLVYQTSIKFASRALFIIPLLESNNRDYIIDNLGLADNLKSDFRGNNIPVEDLELCLSINKDAYKKLAKNEEVSEIKSFVETVSFGVAGLFYFIGMLLKKLSVEKEINEFSPDIYFGGNGSNVFNWLNSGSIFRDSAYRADLFKDMLKAGWGMDENVSINISSTLKAEAAGGMVVHDTESLIAGQEKLDQRDIVIGEDIILINGKTISWSNSVEDSLGNEDIEAVSLDNIMRFVNEYNRVYRELFETRNDIIKYDDLMHKKLQAKVKDQVLLMKRDQQLNKPVFISAIEVLIKDADKINLMQI